MSNPETKNVIVYKDDWKKLQELKLQYGLKTIGDVVHKVLKESR